LGHRKKRLEIPFIHLSIHAFTVYLNIVMNFFKVIKKVPWKIWKTAGEISGARKQMATTEDLLRKKWNL
jgi:hypothetical protein